MVRASMQRRTRAARRRRARAPIPAPRRNLMRAMRTVARRPIPGTRPRRAAATAIRGDASTLHVKGQERAYVVVPQNNTTEIKLANTCSFWPGNSGIPRLDRYGSMFDQYRINNLTVHYYTASGTTTSGMQLTAFDFDSSVTPTTISELQVCQPRTRTAVWQDGSFRPSPQRLNKSKWMFTGASNKTTGFGSAGTILTSAPAGDVANYGEIWVTYDVTFCSPSNQSPQQAQQFTLQLDFNTKLSDKRANWVGNSTEEDKSMEAIRPYPPGDKDLTLRCNRGGWYMLEITGPRDYLASAWQTLKQKVMSSLPSSVVDYYYRSDFSLVDERPIYSAPPIHAWKVKLRLGDLINLPAFSYNYSHYAGQAAGAFINPALTYLFTKLTNTEEDMAWSRSHYTGELPNLISWTGPKPLTSGEPEEPSEEEEEFDVSFSDCHLRINLLTGKWFPIDVLGVNIGNIGYSIAAEDLIGLKYREDGQVYVVVDTTDTLMHANKVIE